MRELPITFSLVRSLFIFTTFGGGGLVLAAKLVDVYADFPLGKVVVTWPLGTSACRTIRSHCHHRKSDQKVTPVMRATKCRRTRKKKLSIVRFLRWHILDNYVTCLRIIFGWNGYHGAAKPAGVVVSSGSDSVGADFIVSNRARGSRRRLFGAVWNHACCFDRCK